MKGTNAGNAEGPQACRLNVEHFDIGPHARRQFCCRAPGNTRADDHYAGGRNTGHAAQQQAQPSVHPRQCLTGIFYAQAARNFAHRREDRGVPTLAYSLECELLHPAGQRLARVEQRRDLLRRTKQATFVGRRCNDLPNEIRLVETFFGRWGDGRAGANVFVVGKSTGQTGGLLHEYRMVVAHEGADGRGCGGHSPLAFGTLSGDRDSHRRRAIACGEPRRAVARTAGGCLEPVPETSTQLEFASPDQLRDVLGELGRNLGVVARATGAQVSQRGAGLRVSGPVESVALATSVLQQLYEMAGAGHQLTAIDVDQACRLLRVDRQASLLAYHAETILVGTRKRAIYPRTQNQRVYVRQFAKHDIVFGLGPAGTGKTYLAMAVAVAALLKDKVRKIVLVRPAVEAGEKLGFLPGDIAEKVNPYLRPLYDALYDMVDEERAGRMIDRGVIEVAPLAFMRGRTLNGSFIILDEAQNATEEQMKMFLTRLGNESCAAVTGDLSQIDLPRGTRSGLRQAARILDGVEGIGMTHFTAADIVRHPLVGEIVRAYDRDAESRRANEQQRRADQGPGHWGPSE